MKNVRELIDSSNELLKMLNKDTSPQKQVVKEKRTLKRAPESGKGYVYEYNDKGKLVPKARLLMEKKIGRPLRDHEIVMYRNGDRKDFSESNLVLGFKAGVDYQQLECAHCHHRAGWLINGVNKKDSENVT
jgi:hypothetical protein